MELPVSLAKNVEFLRHLPKFKGMSEIGRGFRQEFDGPLTEVRDFGTNPGNLRMLAFVPQQHQPSPGLVVVLHGCGQTAAGYDHGAGWSSLAKRYGFALLVPEQSLANNANRCFNWFNPDDIAHGRGEAASIRQMVARMVADHKIDPRRIFVTGLSAGGAMTAAMLALYPELFAAGAIIAGIPFGVAADVREALARMRASPARTPRELGDFVRRASAHKGAWPKLSVWHGSADNVVHPDNATEIVKQWLDLHDLPMAPMANGLVSGHPHQVWWNANGETVVESYTVTGMSHGTPLGEAEDEQRYGMPGAFLIEAGISSSHHIAKFFGLTGWIHQDQPASAASAGAKPKPPSPMSAHAIPMPDLSASPWPQASRKTRPADPPKDEPRRGIDVGAVITRALTAAGLMK